MCGIVVIVNQNDGICKSRINNLIHRGPDGINSIQVGNVLMEHSRLHIIGNTQPQPIINDEIYLVMNGEIFNWKALEIELNYKTSQSDCEILIPLYKKYIRNNPSEDFKSFFNALNGQFSFVIYDKKYNKIFVGRDHVGITPLYIGYKHDTTIFASELKCMLDDFDVYIFEPRTYLYTSVDNLNKNTIHHKYLQYEEICIDKKHNDVIKICELIKLIESYTYSSNIKNLLIESTHLQLKDILEQNIEFGVLLSGGLDSSLIASIISKKYTQYTNKKIKTFSFGFKNNSVDLIAARKVSEFIGSEHYEFVSTMEEGINAIKPAIWYMETYDTTTVRAGTAMYLLTSHIKNKFPQIKVLFSGELSDELFCYLYGSNAPNIKDFQDETIKLVNNVHMFDCLRANKTCMANSMEVRVPFTDPNYIKYILTIPTRYKIFGLLYNRVYPNNKSMHMEKQLLRNAFDNKSCPHSTTDLPKYLPPLILYRKKEAFSDGVSSSFNNTDSRNCISDNTNSENWVDSIITYANANYQSDETYTSEQVMYRSIFKDLFCKDNNGSIQDTVKYWEPNWSTDKADPSARKHIVNECGDGFLNDINNAYCKYGSKINDINLYCDMCMNNVRNVLTQNVE